MTVDLVINKIFFVVVKITFKGFSHTMLNEEGWGKLTVETNRPSSQSILD